MQAGGNAVDAAVAATFCVGKPDRVRVCRQLAYSAAAGTVSMFSSGIGGQTFTPCNVIPS